MHSDESNLEVFAKTSKLKEIELMSKAGRKISGFFTAMIIAVLSFFIVFFFFSDVSERVFGVSFKNSPELTQKASEAVDQAVEKVTDTVTEKVTEKVTETVNKIK